MCKFKKTLIFIKMSEHSTTQIIGLCSTIFAMTMVFLIILGFICLIHCHEPLILGYTMIINLYRTKFNNYQNIIDRNYEEL